MGKSFCVVVVLLFCFASGASAAAWRPDRFGSHSNGVHPAAGENQASGFADDYLKTSDQPVLISQIGAYVRNGWAELSDGREVSGAEVIDVRAQGPAASAGIRSAKMAVLISLLQTVDSSAHTDTSDHIFAVDSERVRNILDLADRVERLATGDRVYLTIARRGRRVRISVIADNSGAQERCNRGYPGR